MNKKEMAAGVVFLILAAVLFTYTTTIPVREGQPAALGAGFYPRLLSVILGILSLLQIKAAAKVVPVPEDCPPPEKKVNFFKTKGALNLLFTVILLILYPFVLQFLGFATAAFLFLVVMIFILTADAKKHLPMIFGLAIILTVVMYIIFKTILRIPFPSGLLI